MRGTIANTDEGWFEFLRGRPELDEVNFWSPSPRRTFRGEPFSPFFSRLGAPRRVICGFAFFARFERLPVWLAWEAFGFGNGVDSLPDLHERLRLLRTRIRYEPGPGPDEIGCIILVEPVLFPPELWVREPQDWKPRTQAYRFYDLEAGEGRRVWEACRAAARRLADMEPWSAHAALMERAARYGAPHMVRPRRLFDLGYVTVNPDLAFLVSSGLRDDYENGRTYYPLHGRTVRIPRAPEDQPSRDLLAWHHEAVFRN